MGLILTKAPRQTTYYPVSEASLILHKYIVNGDIEHVTTFLKSKVHSEPYLNEKRKSAAFVAIEQKEFDIYSLLISHGIRFASDDERTILNELSSNEKQNFDKALNRNLIEIKDAAVHFLLSNTKFINSNSEDKIKDIERYFKELNEIPEIGLVFSVIKCSGFDQITFDFELDSTADIEPNTSIWTRGLCHYKDDKIFFGAKQANENVLKGTIAHELTHYAMQIVYSNDCNPYEIDDTEENTKFHNVITAMEEYDIDYDDIIERVFECYGESDWPSELIVRVNHMLAFHGRVKGETLLKTQASELLQYYRESVVEHCERFMKDSLLLKPKSEIENFNMSSGLITKIKESNITFKQSLRSELEAFITGENSVLLVATPSSMLSTIKCFQSANEMQLSFNQYILVDIKKYLIQPNVIGNLLQLDSCLFLILKISKNLKIENNTKLQQFLNNMSNILKAKPKLKVTIVFEEMKLANVVQQLSEQINLKYKLMEETNLSFTNLSEETQNYLLSKKVEFQGEQTLLKVLITENDRQLINANLLTYLISIEEIKIGSRISTENFDPNTYISRELIAIDSEHESNPKKLEFSIKPEEAPITFTEMELVENVCNEKLVLIADDAGSGKSTLLTRIAILIKQQFKSLWLIRVNLNNFTQTFRNKLNSGNQFSTSEAIDLLIKSQQLLIHDSDNADLSHELFKINLHKVVVMFDGFDEINPTYTSIVKSLTKATMDANVKQIWLTTRPHCKTMLEKDFHCQSFQINPINEEKQLQYLVKFWKNTLKLEDKDDEFETIAKHLQKVIKKTAIGTRSFLENPLHLNMFAEQLLSQCKEILQYSKSILNIPNFTERFVRIGDLYDKFVAKKFDVYQYEKLQLDSTKVTVRGCFLREEFEIHEVAALKLFFKPNEIEALLANVGINAHWLEMDRIETFGLIKKFKDGPPEFIHLTFAEYFVATFIARKLLLRNITEESAKLLLQTVFVTPRFKAIRSMLNDILKSATIKETKNPGMLVYTWERCFRRTKVATITEPLREGNDKIIEFLCTCFNGTELMSTFSIYCPEFENTTLHLSARNNNKELISLLIDDYKFNVDINNENGETLLHVGCKYSSKETIKFLIQDYKANFEAVDYCGRTPLHHAAQSNDKQVINMLINDYGANVDVVDNDGNTPLLRAASYNSKAVIQMFIDKGAEVNAADKDGETPLLKAASKNSKEVIQMLMNDYGAHVNAVDKYDQTPLLKAAYENTKEVIQMLIDCGAIVNAVDKDGETPLLRAASNNSHEVVKLFIDHGANVNAVDKDSETPLLRAAHYNRKDLIKMLMDNGANVNAADKDGKTPLLWAARYNQKEVIKMFIDYEANVNAVDKDGETPLLKAASNSSKEVIQMLIDSGANVNAADKDGKTPLLSAAYRNTKEVIMMLIDSGANVNAAAEDGSTPLLTAAQYNRKEVIKMLIDDGANVNSADNDGKTPLLWAARYNQKEVIKMFIDYEANVNAVDKDGETPLLKAAYENSKEVIEMLIANGANVNAVDNYGKTPILRAASNNRKEVIQVLIDHGAIVNAVDKDGETPFLKAADSNSKEVIEMLIDNGADVNVVDKDDKTPLLRAARHNSKEVIQLLIDHGANVNAVDKDGETPILKAAYRNTKEVIKMLIDNGANVNAVDKDGKTPILRASDYNRKEVIRMLIGNGANENAADTHGKSPL